MKRNIIFAVAATSALLLFFSCTKQDETPTRTFKAIIEKELTKTTIGDYDSEKKGYPIAWSYGDRVRINDAEYSAMPNEEKPGEAALEYVDGSVPEPPYKAVFPYSLYNSKTRKYEFPRVQKYEEGKLNTPMIADGEDDELYFHSICAVICFELKGEGTVKQIQITSEDKGDGARTLCGPFTIDEKNFFYRGMETEWCEFDYITLDCGKGVELNKSDYRKFYLYLPPVSYPAKTLDIRFFDYDEKWTHYELTSKSELELKEGALYTIRLDGVKFTNDPQYDPHYHSTDAH